MDMDLTLWSKIVWCAFIVLWAGLRWRPNVRSRRHGIKLTRRPLKEQISLAISFSGLGLLPGIWVFSGLPSALDYSPDPRMFAIGIGLFGVSLVLFRLTHKALGVMWSNSLDLREGHQLITTSIYSNLRHPMYSAFWLWALAQAFLLPNWLAGFAGLVGFGTLFFLRIGQEEKMMEMEFGESYREYVKKTKRIIPGIY
ncbi:MAG: protein-S-isoprenylcysteine O-methyltransferase [Rhizobiaceae bacterium]|nr:protein-S-isoprenylcysteine O-methyltransferase [Rhizobiaceae bacterium]